VGKGKILSNGGAPPRYTTLGSEVEKKDWVTCIRVGYSQATNRGSGGLLQKGKKKNGGERADRKRKKRRKGEMSRLQKEQRGGKEEEDRFDHKKQCPIRNGHQ